MNDKLPTNEKNFTTAMTEKRTPTKSSFLNIPVSKTTAFKNTEKKDAKRNLKETTRQNLEILKAVKNTKEDTTTKLENQLETFGTDIKNSITDLRDTIEGFAKVIQNAITKNTEPTQRKEPTTKHQQN